MPEPPIRALLPCGNMRRRRATVGAPRRMSLAAAALLRLRAALNAPVSSAPDPPSEPTLRVLLLSASMGAGHDGAAREMAIRLRAEGHHAVVRDFLDAGPLHLGPALREGYEFELRHAPGAYDATYRFWYRVPWLGGPLAWLIALLSRRRVLRWVHEVDANVVVSTYPLATLALGRLRATGRLTVPAVNFITDFGVHPLWVHPGMDLNLAVHQGPADLAARRSSKPAVACGPVVSEAFDPGPAPDARRRAARQELGLAPGGVAVLVVAGSWGIGGILDTFRAAAAGGAITPVVVCGNDERLRRTLRAEADRLGIGAVILGWTDRMPELMVACDALVENAGGLTSLEAMRAGLPVVSYRPIAGHGRENTAAMAAAGVSRLAVDANDLASTLARVTRPGLERHQLISRGQAMFASDPASHVTDTAALADTLPAPARRRRRTRVRIAAALAGVAGLTWTGLTVGVGVAAAAGLGVAHPQPDAGQVAYLGVRLNAADLADPPVLAHLKQLDATAVIDTETAATDPGALQRLAGSGVDVESGGRGGELHGPGDPPNPASPWTRAQHDVGACRAIGALTGQAVVDFIPGRRVNAWDMVDTADAHVHLVVADVTLDAARPATAAPASLSARHIYLVKGLGASPAQLDAVLRALEARLASSHLQGAPLDTLR